MLKNSMETKGSIRTIDCALLTNFNKDLISHHSHAGLTIFVKNDSQSVKCMTMPTTTTVMVFFPLLRNEDELCLFKSKWFTMQKCHSKCRLWWDGFYKRSLQSWSARLLACSLTILRVYGLKCEWHCMYKGNGNICLHILSITFHC